MGTAFWPEAEPFCAELDEVDGSRWSELPEGVNEKDTATRPFAGLAEAETFA